MYGDHRFDAIDAFVHLHRLHQTVPVDLSPLKDCYEVWYRPLASNDGKPRPVCYGIAISAHGEGGIIVEVRLPLELRRAVEAHEASHLLLDHFDHRECIGNWWTARHEREAHIGAGKMLISDDSIRQVLQGRSLVNIADQLAIPCTLAKLYWDYWKSCHQSETVHYQRYTCV